MSLFTAHAGQPLDANARAFLRPLVEKASLTWAINDAWLLVAILTASATLCVPFLGKAVRPADAAQTY